MTTNARIAYPWPGSAAPTHYVSVMPETLETVINCLREAGVVDSHLLSAGIREITPEDRMRRLAVAVCLARVDHGMAQFLSDSVRERRFPPALLAAFNRFQAEFPSGGMWIVPAHVAQQ